MRPHDQALATLRERYARDEISREEYESRRRDLAANRLLTKSAD